eukprot:12907080-Prorocentrum_lima.AAC.1
MDVDSGSAFRRKRPKKRKGKVKSRGKGKKGGKKGDYRRFRPADTGPGRGSSGTQGPCLLRRRPHWAR